MCIRDRTIHRLLREYCRGRLDNLPPDDVSELTALGEHATAAERRAEAAEREVREVLVLKLLEGKVGERFDGVITGVANFGVFVQSPRFLVEGLIRLQDLGDDWWDVDPRYGRIVGERSGRQFRIGDVLTVAIAGVDIPRRQLDLVPVRDMKTPKRAKRQSKGRKPSGRKSGR